MRPDDDDDGEGTVVVEIGILPVGLAVAVLELLDGAASEVPVETGPEMGSDAVELDRMLNCWEPMMKLSGIP